MLNPSFGKMQVRITKPVSLKTVNGSGLLLSAKMRVSLVIQDLERTSWTLTRAQSATAGSWLLLARLPLRTTVLSRCSSAMRTSCLNLASTLSHCTTSVCQIPLWSMISCLPHRGAGSPSPNKVMTDQCGAPFSRKLLQSTGVTTPILSAECRTPPSTPCKADRPPLSTSITIPLPTG